jgi:ectoine hydroxylase-related dioxygenase (phytanoyl-CoA dioxygenase family)
MLYRERGYALFPGALRGDALALLRAQCDGFVAREDARMDAAGTDHLDLSHRGQRYFANECQREMPALRRILFGAAMADICRSTLGNDAYFFFDQFVVKGGGGGMAFAWHQDSAYAAAAGVPDHAPYLTCWCPLDDSDATNGTVAIVPESHRRGLMPHARTATADLAARVDEDAAITVEARAGDVVAFTSHTLHATGPNNTATPRRVYLAQYSARPILDADGHLRRNAIAFVRDGVQVTFG